jgi:hypothetical protein
MPVTLKFNRKNFTVNLLTSMLCCAIFFIGDGGHEQD